MFNFDYALFDAKDYLKKFKLDINIKIKEKNISLKKGSQFCKKQSLRNVWVIKIPQNGRNNTTIEIIRDLS